MMENLFHTRKFGTDADRAEVVRRPVAERQWMIENLLFSYKRFQDVSAEIGRFHLPVAGGLHGTGVIGGLLGEPRAGKSYICKHYAARYPKILTDVGEEYPVICLEARADWSPTHCAEQIFLKTGGRFVPGLKFASLVTRCLDRLVQVKNQLFILDDAHLLLLDPSGKQLRDFKSIVKGIADLNTCNLLVCGLPPLQSFMEDDGQIGGRGDFPHWSVQALDWGLTDEREQFALLVHGIDERLPFRELSGLARYDNLEDLYRNSDGKIGRVMNIVKDAAKRALNEDCAHILPEHLQGAAKDRLRVGQRYVGFGYEEREAA